jgi:hypothetical protein
MRSQKSDYHLQNPRIEFNILKMFQHVPDILVVALPLGIIWHNRIKNERGLASKIYFLSQQPHYHEI